MSSRQVLQRSLQLLSSVCNLAAVAREIGILVRLMQIVRDVRECSNHGFHRGQKSLRTSEWGFSF